MRAQAGCETAYYRVGMTIDDRYRLEEFVGEGGMACVYKARERNAPHIYAIKFLKGNLLSDQEFLDNFQREATYMKEIAHPNIVRFYDFVRHDDFAYIVMDYIDGYSLLRVIKKMRQLNEKMPVDEVVRILTQAARGLDRIHRAGLIHRDVKPGNILIASKTGTTYVADLGIIADTKEDNTLSLAAGTRAYMPPEQQIGDRVDHTADIYALGVMAFEMFAGQRPFSPDKGLNRHEAEDDLIRKHFEAPIPLISQLREELPTAMDDVLTKALAKKPDERYQSVLEFAQDVHKVLAPRLTPELRAFAEIKPMRPREEMIPDDGVASRSTRGLLTVAILTLILMGLGLVVIGWWTATNNAPTATVTPSTEVAQIAATELPTETATLPATFTPRPSETPTDTATAVPTDTATLTTTPTATITPSPVPTTTDTPTETLTATATYTLTPTPSPIPTTYLDGEQLFDFLSGAGALGLVEGSPLIVTLDAATPLVRLNVGMVNGFRISVTLASDLAEIRRFGIAYRVQDDNNYLLFSVNPEEQRWQIRIVQDGVVETLESGDLTVSEPLTLTVSGQDEYFRLEVGDMVLQRQNFTWTSGSLGLWIESNVQNISLESLSISLLGRDALTAVAATPTPFNVIDVRAALRRDIEAMLATANIQNTTINCPDYIPLFEGLENYLSYPDVTAVAQQTIDAGQLVYSRCIAESPNAALSFVGSTRDYFAWQQALNALIAELSEE